MIGRIAQLQALASAEIEGAASSEQVQELRQAFMDTVTRFAVRMTGQDE